MTGQGRCRRRGKYMAGGSGAAEGKKIVGNLNNPNLKREITEKPLISPRITKRPPTSSVDFLDLYTQARKALSFTSPFDSEDSQARQSIASSAPTLPSGVSHLLGNRHSGGRKRRKKLHSGTDIKTSIPGKLRESNIWVETEEYFRELNVEDIEKFDRISSVGFSINDKSFLIPFLNDDGNPLCRDSTTNGMLTSVRKNYSLNLGSVVESSDVGKLEHDDGTMAQEGNELQVMDMNGFNNRAKELENKGDNNREKSKGIGNNRRSFSGVEWLLGSKRKVYLTSERPSKKRKLLGRDAGLEKLLVACPVEGSEEVCHYCSFGDMGDPLNFLIKCGSCGMMVHQRCYGVQEDVNTSWLCSWCKWKNAVDTRIETPCFLCPKQGGALKPVQKSCFGNESEGCKVEFAHLFCCQWLSEVYLENTRTMEPIMNIGELKDTKKKMNCYLCKVKYGACVRCSNGSCRTSFHPICAREAGHRMEIWGKLGSDEVELRAFCGKHSKVQFDSDNQRTGETSLTADGDNGKHYVVFDGDEIIDKRKNSESLEENKDAQQHAALCSENGKVSNLNILNFTMMLKRLIELGKISPKDVASEIGVLPDSLNAVLTDDHMVPELQYKLLKWLKNHVHFGNLQNALKLKIRSLITPKSVDDVAECVGAISEDGSIISDSVPVKSVPPRRRTKSNLRTMNDDKLFSSKDKNSDETSAGDADLSLIQGKALYGPSVEFLVDNAQKILIDSQQLQDNPANNSTRIEGKVTDLAHCLSDENLVDGSNQGPRMIMCSSDLLNGDVHCASYMHPLIYCKLMQTNDESLEKTASDQSAVLMDGEASQLETSSSSDLCSNNNLQALSGGCTSKCDEVNLDQFLWAKNMDMLKLSPSDELEGELLYYQQRLLANAAARKRMSDNLIAKVVGSLSKEIDATGERKWDTVLVSQYTHELQEAKKRGRKERRQKEAQAVFATATAATAGSSRVSSIRKDNLDESSQQGLPKNAYDMRFGSQSKLNLKLKQSIPTPAIMRSSFDANSDSAQSTLKDHPRTCDICRRPETVWNPILLCSSCKVAVHMGCYCHVKSTIIPWHCELCEELLSSLDCGAVATNSCEKPYMIAECGICGGSAGAFRKSENGHWIHAFCAEWVLESTYKRGQANPIEGMDNVVCGVDTCTVCQHKHGVCLKCSYGHCQTRFHPTCAKSAGFFMTVKTDGSKVLHKAYCEKHSIEQRAKASTQRHGIEEFKSLKLVRVELERVRLLCERIIKREKLKRELVLCSHDVLATSRDSVLSALARHPFYQPDFSSESATTSVRGLTDSHRSGSGSVQRSDDITIDSTVAGKRRVRLPTSMDNDDSSTSQNLNMVKPQERASFSGKQIPQRGIAARSLTESRYREIPFLSRGEMVPEAFPHEPEIVIDEPFPPSK
ncbi:uncharacterized protein LOC127246404 isoform X2 [Andrographis paniculata]|uniref:uncharacterized protein LOC127246404 isoform X2 n=1 Tax=Andrographis paniculata TaxID=175694 RepID=UPI0021E8FD52|nr:uncharacterized protein LOC127246404 isoform X2 [Andrographis paniculata]XP_051123705.1 uncharacterized protein LOC127246404 isoform X2 [Andrographis paniculata]